MTRESDAPHTLEARLRGVKKFDRRSRASSPGGARDDAPSAGVWRSAREARAGPASTRARYGLSPEAWQDDLVQTDMSVCDWVSLRQATMSRLFFWAREDRVAAGARNGDRLLGRRASPRRVRDRRRRRTDRLLQARAGPPGPLDAPAAGPAPGAGMAATRRSPMARVAGEPVHSRAVRSARPRALGACRHLVLAG